MPPEIVDLLVQVPLVAVFAWFVIYSNREWRRFLKDRNDRLESAMLMVSDRLAEVAEKLNELKDK